MAMAGLASHWRGTERDEAREGQPEPAREAEKQTDAAHLGLFGGLLRAPGIELLLLRQPHPCKSDSEPASRRTLRPLFSRARARALSVCA